MFHLFRSLESLPERVGVLSLWLTLSASVSRWLTLCLRVISSRSDGYLIPLGFLMFLGMVFESVFIRGLGLT